MSGTDELRRLLDKLGVEWRGGLPTETIVSEPIDALYVERSDGMMRVYFRSYLTPEQAVAATLGAGPCRRVRHDGDAVFQYCSKCGGMLARWLEYDDGNAHFCPSCGRRVVDE